MPYLKLSALVLAVTFITGCDSSSSNASGGGASESGNGVGSSAEVSALFSASADGEPAALDLQNLPSSLNEIFGSANDEPKSVNSEAVTGLISQ